MAQVNKYADRAAYTADAKRLSTKSAVSFIENETTTIYDGVNTVVGKSAGALGDLAVLLSRERWGNCKLSRRFR